MTVLAWLVEGSWPACVDAVRRHADDAEDVVLLHVSAGDEPGVAHGAFAGLLGRGHGGHDPGARVAELGADSAGRLLDAAAARLGRPCVRRERRGRAEREVVRAAEGADLLVVARDGDRARLGPHSLGHAARFVVDHAPCAVLLVWPTPAPGLETIPPPPPPPPAHGPRPPHAPQPPRPPRH